MGPGSRGREQGKVREGERPTVLPAVDPAYASWALVRRLLPGTVGKEEEAQQIQIYGRPEWYEYRYIMVRNSGTLPRPDRRESTAYRIQRVGDTGHRYAPLPNKNVGKKSGTGKKRRTGAEAMTYLCGGPGLLPLLDRRPDRRPMARTLRHL